MSKDALIEKQFADEIKRLLIGVPPARFAESRELMKDYLEKIQTVEYRGFFNIECAPREMSLVKAALFLLDYEGKFGFCINLTYYLFVWNDPKSSSFSFTDIEKKSISEKCEYLAKHGFHTFDESSDVTLRELRELRNTIAHFKFVVTDDGTLSSYDRNPSSRNAIGILSEHGKLLVYLNGMIPVLREYTKMHWD
jgi:hypothetical protein